MNIKYIKIITCVLFILPMLISIFSFFKLPDSIPLQWNHNGNINYYGSKNFIFILPFLAITIGSFIIIWLSKHNLSPESLKSSLFFLVNTGIFLNFFYVLMLILTFKSINGEAIPVQIIKLVPVAIGIFIIISGLILTRISPDIMSIPEILKPVPEKRVLFAELIGYNTILGGIFIVIMALAFPLHTNIIIIGVLIILLLGPIGIIKVCLS